MERGSMKVFGLAGWSGSGKTTLLCNLLPELIGRGLRVSTVKHAHRTFDVASPHSSDARLRAAGACEVMFAAPARWALLHELADGSEPSLEELLPRLHPVDLVMIEGFKSHPHDKLEVYRPANGKPLLAPNDPHIVAIASDGEIAGVTRRGRAVPILDLNDISGIAELIIEHCGLARGPERGLRTG